MPKRESFKDIDIQGRKWRITRFDALTGSYIAYKLLFQMLPMGIEENVPGMNLPKGRSLMTKEEFVDLQKDCLAVCSELTVVGNQQVPIPILMRGGSWAIDGIDQDIMLVMVLTMHCLVFNISSFFEQDALNDLTDSFKALNPFNAST